LSDKDFVLDVMNNQSGLESKFYTIFFYHIIL